MAITKIPAAGFTGNNFRNIIINGDMSIAQRGTSATGLGEGDNGYHTCDRWKFLESGTPTYEFTQTQDTDVPSGQGFSTSLKMNCTTAQATLNSDDLIRIVQINESQNLQYLKYGTANAESLTASFWVKSNVTGDYNINLYNYGSGGGARIISSTYTINSADTWEKKIITFAGDTVEAVLNDNTAGLNFTFTFGAGTNYTSADATSWGAYSSTKIAYGQVANLASSTSNYINITGIQLEAGTTASDFEFLPVDVNLARCQRYYQRQNPAYSPTFVRAKASPANAYLGSNTFSVIMRAAPTVTLNFASSSIVKDGIRFDTYTLAATTSNNNSWGVIIVPAIDDSNNYHAYGNGGYIEANAEL